MNNPSQSSTSHQALQSSLTKDSKQPLLPISSQPNPKENSIPKWRILILACLSTFCAFLTFHLFSLLIVIKTLQIDQQEYNNTIIQVQGYACLAPFIAGIIISRFGFSKANYFFAFLLAMGRILTTISLRNPNWELFLLGELLFNSGNMGLFVPQLYITIKSFKRKNLSLALGLLLVSYEMSIRVGYFVLGYVSDQGLAHLLYIGTGLCFLAGVSVIILNKIALKMKETEQRRSFIGEIKLIKPIVGLLILGVFCFSVGDSATVTIYMDEMTSRFRKNNYTVYSIIGSINLWIPIIMLPLLGSLIDIKKKRIAMMLAGILMFFIGNTAFFLTYQRTNHFGFLYAGFLLFDIASPLFRVSSWAFIGTTAHTKVLGLVLGIVYGFVSLVCWYLSYISNQYNQNASADEIITRNVCCGASIALIVGVVLMVFTWALDRKERGRAPSSSRKAEEMEDDGVKNERNEIRFETLN